MSTALEGLTQRLSGYRSQIRTVGPGGLSNRQREQNRRRDANNQALFAAADERRAAGGRVLTLGNVAQYLDELLTETTSTQTTTNEMLDTAVDVLRSVEAAAMMIADNTRQQVLATQRASVQPVVQGA